MLSLRTQLTTIFSFALVVLLVSSVYAQNLQSVKASMLERKPTVDSLKNKGLVGEGNDGYLHVRKAADNAKKVVNSENADRGIVYKAIATKEGTAVEKVGKRRALQLAGMAPSGHWFLKGDGTWFKK